MEPTEKSVEKNEQKQEGAAKGEMQVVRTSDRCMCVCTSSCQLTCVWWCTCLCVLSKSAWINPHRAEMGKQTKKQQQQQNKPKTNTKKSYAHRFRKSIKSHCSIHSCFWPAAPYRVYGNKVFIVGLGTSEGDIYINLIRSFETNNCKKKEKKTA